MIQTINGLSIDKRIIVYTHSGMSISHRKHGHLMRVIIRMNFVNIMVGERSQSHKLHLVQFHSYERSEAESLYRLVLPGAGGIGRWGVTA